MTTVTTAKRIVDAEEMFTAFEGICVMRTWPSAEELRKICFTGSIAKPVTGNGCASFFVRKAIEGFERESSRRLPSANPKAKWSEFKLGRIQVQFFEIGKLCHLDGLKAFCCDCCCCSKLKMTNRGCFLDFFAPGEGLKFSTARRKFLWNLTSL